MTVKAIHSGQYHQNPFLANFSLMNLSKLITNLSPKFAVTVMMNLNVLQSPQSIRTASSS